MFNTVRLHTDAQVSPDVAIQLRMHDFDAVSAREMQMLKASDDVHLAWAAAERRTIITFDRDFMRLHNDYLAAGQEHWGIIFSTEEDTRTLIRRMLRLLNTLTADDLRNQFLWLNNFR